MSKASCVLLYSGGLDSLLAAKILMNQGITVTGFHCILPFVPPDLDPETLDITELARQIGLNLDFHRLDGEYVDIVRNPPHGYGKNMNPCIDCKMHFLQKAIEYMKQTGADFIATGEVVGQRPMSQMKHMLNHINNVSHIKGGILRPLSARILQPTVPEIEGLVDREQLLGISGRSRKTQMMLAKRYNIPRYSSPAGGCLFTDPSIARRVKDLFDHHEFSDTLDLYFLTVGRHFRLSQAVKIIVSRNEKENRELEKYRTKHDYYLEPQFKGPAAAVKGPADEKSIRHCCRIVSRYGKPEEEACDVAVYKKGILQGLVKAGPPMHDDELERLRL